jgi:hypothetical protein
MCQAKIERHTSVKPITNTLQLLRGDLRQATRRVASAPQLHGTFRMPSCCTIVADIGRACTGFPDMNIRRVKAKRVQADET